MKKGFVYLIGAGPGDPLLISQKAIEAIQSADCIIYDFLANPGLLNNEASEIIYVGKKGSDHTLSQDEINRLIIEKAQAGKVVARLKGGDPFIFGRGGEEAEDLVAAGISFAVIPGISSFYSAPAYAGIPLTHRDCANSFEVITGHRRADAGESEDINYPDYNTHKTFVFLMGMKNLAIIANRLITDKNFPSDTPVAVVMWGTTPSQRVATGTLSTIADNAEKAGLSSPAIIIVGTVVLLRKSLRWFDNRPLFGKNIVVTRTRQQSSKLSLKLGELGARVIEFPTIEIKPKTDMGELNKALDKIEQYNWIVFTSQNAVQIFFKALSDRGSDTRSLAQNKIAAIGPASGQEIEQYGIRPDLVPDEFVAEALTQAMSDTGISGKRILLPCAAEARQTLKEGLEEAGASVDRIHIYDTITPEDITEERISQISGTDLITFTSSSTVRNFFKIIPKTDARLACIGPVTAKTVEELGFTPTVTAAEYTIDGLVEAILQLYQAR